MNTATVTSDSGDLDTDDNSATAIAPTQPDYDLDFTKTADTTHYSANGPVSFVITVHNNGPSSATGAHVTDSLPAFVHNATWSCTGGCQTASGTGDVDTIVDLAPTATATITITGTGAPARSATSGTRRH